MRGEIYAAGRAERVGIGVPADRLESVADGALGMTIVDHQRGAAVAREALAQLQRDIVGAPFEDRRVRRIAARRASFIMVPRPGPSSMMRRFSGEPICFQVAAIQRPIISPNIWLTSGAVMKSPRAPSGSRVV